MQLINIALTLVLGCSSLGFKDLAHHELEGLHVVVMDAPFEPLVHDVRRRLLLERKVLSIVITLHDTSFR